jgi:8-demethyl-8-alpha-L-rhamnosyltetracenomycin-C 2'-O-methyltransferase
MRTLHEIFDDPKHAGSDKTKIHSYGDLYSKLLAPYRDNAATVLEVGVRDGSSLRAWAEYFTNAEIVGIENGSEAGLPVFTDEEQQRITLIVGDTTRPGELMRKINEEFNLDSVNRLEPLFDVIIDDGLHHPYGQVATWATLSPFLRPGGLFVVEDIEDVGFAKEMQRLFGGEVIDLRETKQRHDDILLVWRKPK